jgi:hypothetical protein
MNILIVSQYYFPEHFLINEIAPEFVKQGHTVTVLTGLPNYPSGKVEKEYKWFKNRKQTIDGVNVVRCLEIGRRNSTYCARTYAPPQVLFPIFILLLIAIYKKGILPSSSSSECKRHLTEPCIYTISPLSGHMVSS